MKTVSNHISLTLKGLRSQKGWSLDKTAKKTGVSKAMLGQIERGESNPTIATLWKIVNGFNTSLSFFVDDLNNKLNQFHSQTETTDKKIRVMPLFPLDTKFNMEIFIVKLSPMCEHLYSPREADIIEHIIVAEGKIEILINDTWQLLNKGTGWCFNGNQQRGYRNVSMNIAVFHSIIHYPNR